MKNNPISKKQMEGLSKGFYPTPFANRKMRRTPADKFTQLKKAVEKRKESEEALIESPEMGKKQIEFINYWYWRNRVNRLANKCYPQRATV